MPSWLKVVLIVGASGVLLLALAIGGVAWWIYAKRGEFKEQGTAAMAEGKEYGAGKSSQACIDGSLTRLAHTSGIMQQAFLGIFLKSCLKSAPRDPALCDGVPTTGEIFRSATWRNDICAAHGHSGDEACARLLGNIQEVCHPTP
jgi:hypothetical protein